MSHSHSDISPPISPVQPDSSTATAAAHASNSAQSAPTVGSQQSVAVGPHATTIRLPVDPDSVDPLDPQPQVSQDPVVSLDPGHHVTILPTNKQDVNSAIIVSAASMKSGNDASQQQGLPTNPTQAAPTKRSFFNVIRAWKWELVACLFATAMVAVEIVLLAVYNNRYVEEWHHSWQINSVFAFVTALLEAAIAFAVGACLGQLRWLWFQKGNQQLRWMDKLTNARAAPGALSFVFSEGAWRHWASLGAVLVVALLGTSVFTQEIIVQKTGTYNVSSSDDSCNVPISNTYYYQWQYGDKDGDEQPYVPMISSLISGFLEPSSTTNEDSIIDLVTCDTGNCTFEEYTSLAVCSKCADISHTIVIPCDTDDCPPSQRVHLPDDSLSLDAVNGYLNITSNTGYPNTSVLPDVGPLIARYRGLGSVNFPETPPYAIECAIYWCVQTYNSSVVATDFTEQVTATWTNLSSDAVTKYGDGKNITLTPNQCFVNGTRSSASKNIDCTYGADASSHRALQNYLVGDSNATGFLTGDVATTNASNGTQWLISTLAANAIIAPCSGYEDSCTADFYGMFEWAITNMTSYMTNNLRKTVDTGPGFSYGTMTDSETHFHVRWGWLAYPIAMVLISLVFVVVTIVKSRDSDPWKSSVVALMFHGFHDADRGVYHKLDDPREMVKATRSWSVSLANLNGTKTFVRHGEVEEERFGEVREAAGKGGLHAGNAVIQAFGESG